MSDPKPITPAELDAIEARERAATPGPWTGIEILTRADREFCRAARSDVPRLVAEVRMLREEVPALRSWKLRALKLDEQLSALRAGLARRPCHATGTEPSEPSSHAAQRMMMRVAEESYRMSGGPGNPTAEPIAKGLRDIVCAAIIDERRAGASRNDTKGHCHHAPKCIGKGPPDERDPLGCCNCGTREAETSP